MVLAALLGALVDRIVCGLLVGLNAAALELMVSSIGPENVLAFILGSDPLVFRAGKIADGIKKVLYKIKDFSGVTGKQFLMKMEWR